MQTILGWEAFCPIPWVEYYPDIGYYGTSNLHRDKLDLRKDYGHFDGEYYSIMSFYIQDYRIGECRVRWGELQARVWPVCKLGVLNWLAVEITGRAKKTFSGLMSLSFFL